jgi:cell division protein FtsX
MLKEFLGQVCLLGVAIGLAFIYGALWMSYQLFDYASGGGVEDTLAIMLALVCFFVAVALVVWVVKHLHRSYKKAKQIIDDRIDESYHGYD